MNFWDADYPEGNSVLIIVQAVAPSGLGAVIFAGPAAPRCSPQAAVNCKCQCSGVPSCLQSNQTGVVRSYRMLGIMGFTCGTFSAL